MALGRRTFLRWSLRGFAGLAISDANRPNATAISSDDLWLASIAAKRHSAFMDVMEFFPDGTPFRRAKTLQRVMHESYAVAEDDIGIAVGMHGRGLAHLLSAAAWEDLELAEWLAPQLN